MLVPVRETVSVPMPHQEVKQDNTRLYVLVGVGILLVLGAVGLGAVAVLRRRNEPDNTSEGE